MSPSVSTMTPVLAIVFWAPGAAAQPTVPGTEESGCMNCHEGIEWIAHPDSGMAVKILALGRTQGDPAGCVVCHGGDPKATTKDLAHGGGAQPTEDPSRRFFPDPGSPWVNQFTCGRCHPEHVDTQWNSPMMTGAGKIQGTVWAFGLARDYEHRWGNYDAQNPPDPTARLGTKAYRAYMERLSTLEPGAFPDMQSTLPPAPTDLTGLAQHPEQAAFTYLRTQCQRCHLAVSGRRQPGEYRGMGCSACHMPYGNEGFYEGGDESIPKDERGHVLVHTIQGTRQVEVTVHDRSYRGIPIKTCNSCHNQTKGIGTSYQGLMDTARQMEYSVSGDAQTPTPGNHYVALQADIHYQKGMLCQDCHTSIDVHGDGFLAGADLAQIEIECSDCHGTPTAYPWELPLGYMDEFQTPAIDEARDVADAQPRGVARTIPQSLELLRLGTHFAAEDGYLLSARGNPFPEVVRRGNHVIVHTASGHDLDLKPLKLLEIEGELSTEARVAMCQADLHMDTMECYACHATWAPQRYGAHITIDYSAQSRSFDWIAAGHLHEDPEHAADRTEAAYDTFTPGKITARHAYVRWEEPALGVNGEGRIAPVMPGCQASVTVIGVDGETIVSDHIFRATPEEPASRSRGRPATDTTPVQPHTVGRARSCESCHLSEKALGYGIVGQALNRHRDRPAVDDLMTIDGEVLPRSGRSEMETSKGPTVERSSRVAHNDARLHAVGHHFSSSRPLNDAERAHVDRKQLCLSCHQEIPTESIAAGFLHYMAEYADMLPKTHQQHSDIIHKMLLSAAWGQAGAALMITPATFVALAWFIRRRRNRNKTRVVNCTPLRPQTTEGQDPNPLRGS